MNIMHFYKGNVLNGHIITEDTCIQDGKFVYGDKYVADFFDGNKNKKNEYTDLNGLDVKCSVINGQCDYVDIHGMAVVTINGDIKKCNIYGSSVVTINGKVNNE